jgi:tetratricopeptide (TPR) repeat protein
MQPYTAELGKTKLRPQPKEVVAGRRSFMADVERGVVLEWDGGKKSTYPIVQVMGGKNVYYFLTPLERGWLQVLPVAYDVRRQEWFDTTASAMRHFGDRGDEALYWKERPLTFNTACFNCHVSQLTKNYELQTDSYQTTWAEPGINCETCHGPGGEHVNLFRQLGTNQPAPADIKLIVTSKLSTAQRNDSCAPCHARMSALTAAFKPGERYFDHFDLVCYENPDFHADGRDLGENYTMTQWLTSPCVKSGKLDCIHCHTSSGRYRFSKAVVANNACLPCHKEKVDNAPAHTRHAADSEGNRCISCHMPMTEFARMRRSDHSMRPPTPATTLKYNSPNACGLCHTNGAAWADKLVREWHRRDYQAPVLERAALLDAARKRDWKQLPAMLEYLTQPDREEIQTVSLVRLLRDCAEELKWPTLRKLTEDASPLVRASVAEILGDRLDDTNVVLLARLAGDSFRLVRVRAAAALASANPERMPAAQRESIRAANGEFLASLRARPDDMASHYNLGNYHLSQGNPAEAAREFEVAVMLQPAAVPPLVNLALARNAQGQNDKAEASLRRALGIEPTNAPALLNLGMLMAELERRSEAEKAFRAAAQCDPKSAQAAYNLGVLLSSTQPEEALRWSRKAAELAPNDPKYAYTLAFYEHQRGNNAGAVETLEQSLARGPTYADAYFLLASIYERQGKAEKAQSLYHRAADDPGLPAEARAHFAARIRAP